MRYNRTNPELDSLLDQIHQNTDSGSLPGREYFKHLANAYSVDFATLYLARQLLENQANQSMQQIFQAEFAQLKNTIDSSTWRQRPEFSSYEIFPGGITIVELGLDHYFQDKEIDLKTAALAQTVITRLESKHEEAVER
jgi:hypothetical protein